MESLDQEQKISAVIKRYKLFRCSGLSHRRAIQLLSEDRLPVHVIDKRKHSPFPQDRIDSPQIEDPSSASVTSGVKNRGFIDWQFPVLSSK
jgi:hypothetical protein